MYDAMCRDVLPNCKLCNWELYLIHASCTVYTHTNCVIKDNQIDNDEHITLQVQDR